MMLAALILAGSLAAAPGTERKTLTLAEAYASALRHSEELAQRGESAAELEAKVQELWANVKPRLTLQATKLLQDVPSGVSGVSSTFTQRNREQSQLVLHQPIFSGLREYLALRAAKSRTRAAELGLERARQLLYQDVGRAYLDVLSVQTEIAVRQALSGITQKRVAELEERRKLGRSRKSELLAAESQRAQIEADLAAARGRRLVAQVFLQFLLGTDEDMSVEDLPTPAARSLEAGLAAVASRPDVEASRRTQEGSWSEVVLARRQRWPSLFLDGNYYLKRPPGFQDRVKWDVLFTVQLPLYAGGSVGAQARQAEARWRSSEQGLSLVLRRARLELGAARRDLDSALSVVKALEAAAELSEANAVAQAEDYRLGMVTNLDVLGSLNSLQETRLKLDQARIGSLWADIRLWVAEGRIQ
ncbi:MAG: TolC family protein [Elusimicrobia bacterium]|nr:TolC family protein [Elusimicrobiota bacterium]